MKRFLSVMIALILALSIVPCYADREEITMFPAFPAYPSARITMYSGSI
ncbi:MAG: hypothetical protein IJC48_07105 [Clostridia bacterium]|nr:hypothetical protein [Clostridia bacterium]MBQ4157840.1 hypothetical protein [Clostridia bacterium]